MMESRPSVAEVYDLAADIGQEFERLLEQSVEAEAVSPLMQKVINALEHLERFAAQQESENVVIENLKSTVAHLEREKVRRVEERNQAALEMEREEESLRHENADLLKALGKTQEENRRLANQLAKVSAEANERDSAFSEEESFVEVDVVRGLRSEGERLRSQLRRVERELQLAKCENDDLSCENEKLASSVRDLRKKCKQQQQLTREALDERAELTIKLGESQRVISGLESKLGLAAMEKEELAMAEKEKASTRVFTLPEIKHVLHERNQLKARLSDLEDELALYRPKSEIESAKMGFDSLTTRPVMGEAECDCTFHRGDEELESLDQIGRASSSESDDRPVQGPLPRDPDDAPWRKGESGIRKLFHRVFGSSLRSLPSSVSTPSLRMEEKNKFSVPKSASRLSFFNE